MQSLSRLRVIHQILRSSSNLIGRHKLLRCDTKLQASTLSPSHITDLLSATFSGSDVNSDTLQKKCSHFCDYYSRLLAPDKMLLLASLVREYGVQRDDLLKVTQSLVSLQNRDSGAVSPAEADSSAVLSTEVRLRAALTPRYTLLFTNIGRIDGGVKFLVDMRADILTYEASGDRENVTSGDMENVTSACLSMLSRSLRDILSLWFTVGFLMLERVTWQSPCDIVQKISEYEAVHPMRNWTDLKRRVGPYRRCFVFTHSSMPREPVVVLHTALTQHISSSIHSIVSHPLYRTPDEGASQAMEDTDTNTAHEDHSLIKAANFYSITSTQKGLTGIDLGNTLIKRVVAQLTQEFPGITQFSSLSPIPGFKDWLITQLNREIHLEEIGESPEKSLLSHDEFAMCEGFGALKTRIQSNSWAQDEQLVQDFRGMLQRLCAQYLYSEKRRGFALNPVANFHLSNGAVLWRLNWLADRTPRGIGQSCGMMVNYRYYLENTEENCRRYLEDQHIECSPHITRLVTHT